MTIRKKIALVVMIVILLSGFGITIIWNQTSKKLTETYLKQTSKSTMNDAYDAFNYILRDTTYMATIISLNENDIIEPVEILSRENLKVNRQWNQTYLNNSRIIKSFINDLYGSKYYIVGISIIVNEDCRITTTSNIPDAAIVYTQIGKLDHEKLKQNVVMMDPIYVEGGKSTLASGYVVPAVRGILDARRNIIGYTVLYFDYGIIESMFAQNLPEGSLFQVVNENDRLIFSNCGEIDLEKQIEGKRYVYNAYLADEVGWNFVMATPSEYYISEINKTNVATWSMIAVILIASVFISVIFVSNMTKEIGRLCENMDEISKGNFDCTYEVKGNDEISRMGNTFNHMAKRIKELLNQVAEKERQKREVEMLFLQAQINPHFISNVLNNIVWMAKIQHAENMIPLINALNSLLQEAMHAKNDMIMLKDELEYVKNYLTIIEYSGSYDFDIKWEIGSDTYTLLVPRFILQPIIENAIQHGLPNDLSRQGKITIRAYREKDLLKLEVEDNGQGISEGIRTEILKKNKKNRKDGKRFNGIGVPNVNERIQLSCGAEYGLHYESETGEYTKAVYQLPVLEEIRKQGNTNEN